MIKTRFAKFAVAIVLAAGGFALGAASKPAPKAVPRAPAAGGWYAHLVVTPQGGYRRGNPDAPAKLVEFVSYTCPHCAHFEIEADAPLRLGFIGTGKGSVEIRPFLRNPIDVAATLAATCGVPARFHANHTAILRAQAKWLRQPSQAEIQRWSNPDFATSMRAIAADLGFYPLMEARGYTRTQLDRCLGDRAKADRIANQVQADSTQYNITGTPSFLVNGELQQGVHDWNALRPMLQALTR